MKTFLEYITEIEIINESPNLSQNLTGLPVIVFVSAKHASHAARIKFQNNYNQKTQSSEFIPMTISDEPEVINPNNIKIVVKEKDLKKIKKWVKKNKKTLLHYWNNEYDDIEMRNNLQKYDSNDD